MIAHRQFPILSVFCNSFPPCGIVDCRWAVEVSRALLSGVGVVEGGGAGLSLWALDMKKAYLEVTVITPVIDGLNNALACHLCTDVAMP